jgi:hypothetical protein
MIAFLGAGLCFSIAGYALLRHDRPLRWVALVLAVVLAGSGLDHGDKFPPLLFAIAYCVASLLVARKRGTPTRKMEDTVA